VTELFFPSSVRFEDLCRFSVQLKAQPVTKNLNFHTAHLSNFTPTSMIFIAKVCRYRRRIFKSEKQTFFGLEQHSYANNLGFSSALNLKDNPYPQGAFGGRNYIPISVMERESLELKCLTDGLSQGDAIEVECRKIAAVVSQSKSEKLLKVLTMSFREIFRNVFEHSNSSNAGYCVQYWPSRDVVEICVSDRGIGFSKSLAEDSRFDNLSDRSALLFSLMPGVSSKAKAHKKKNRLHRSEWDNSGYGLFFAHQLFGEFGRFAVASRTHAIVIDKGKLVGSFPAHIEGSIVSMRLNLGDVDAIDAKIASIKKQAHEVKSRLGVNGLKISSVEAFFR
jgi:anti-sigma regulatory factor (Ser/Thr protein kinase)